MAYDSVLNPVYLHPDRQVAHIDGVGDNVVLDLDWPRVLEREVAVEFGELGPNVFGEFGECVDRGDFE